MSEEKMNEAKKTGSKRTPMAEQSPDIRIRNFDEVPLGYSPEEARAEAARCLKCKKPKCVEGCPVRVDIPGFIKLIEEGEFDRAAKKSRKQIACPLSADESAHKSRNAKYCASWAKRAILWPWAAWNVSPPTMNVSREKSNFLKKRPPRERKSR